MGNCLALSRMHSYGYIDATHRYYKAEGIERVGLDFLRAFATGLPDGRHSRVPRMSRFEKSMLALTAFFFLICAAVLLLQTTVAVTGEGCTVYTEGGVGADRPRKTQRRIGACRYDRYTKRFLRNGRSNNIMPRQ